MPSIGDLGDNYAGDSVPEQTSPEEPMQVFADGGTSAAGGDGGGFSSKNIQGPYLAFKSRTKYVWKTGLSQLPIGSPQGFNGDWCAIVQLHAPVGSKTFSWAVSRRGEEPLLPDVEVDDDNQVFVYGETELDSPDRTLDAANRVFTVRGLYVYALKKPIGIKDGKMFFGGTPFDDESPQAISPGDVSGDMQA